MTDNHIPDWHRNAAHLQAHGLYDPGDENGRMRSTADFVTGCR